MAKLFETAGHENISLVLSCMLLLNGVVAIFTVYLCTVAWKLLKADIQYIMILCYRKNESSLH